MPPVSIRIKAHHSLGREPLQVFVDSSKRHLFVIVKTMYLIPPWLKPILTPNHSTEVKFKGYEMTLHVTEHVNGMNQSQH